MATADTAGEEKCEPFDGVFKYPKARRSDKSYTYKSVKQEKEVAVADPYDWLEDPDSEETKEWVQGQVKVFNSYVSTCDVREPYKKRMTELLNFERYGTPFRRGTRYYYYHNSGLLDHSILYVADTLDAERRVLIDPNSLSEDKTTALKETNFSRDGEMMAYALSRGGSDWTEFQIKKVATGEDFPEVLKWCKFSSLSWTHDSKGFYYNRYETPKEFAKGDKDFKRGTETTKATNQQLYYHVVGTKQEEDIFITDAKTLTDNLEMFVGHRITHDGKYLILSLNDSCDPVNMLYLVDLGEAPKPFAEVGVRKIIDNKEFGYQYITNKGTTFFFKTNNGAKNYRVIAIDVDNPDPENWKEIIPESEDRMESCSISNGEHLFVEYMHHVSAVLYIYDLEGKRTKDDFGLPKYGIMTWSCSNYHDDVFIKFQSFTDPGTCYRYSVGDDSLSVFKETKVAGYDRTLYTVEQVFYASKDGTKVPMFIVGHKDTPRDGSAPTLLYGYGGFDIAITPYFSTKTLMWIQHLRGFYCVANIRGGGEYGERWHEGGKKGNKQNVFDDFHAAAEYLIQEKVTVTGKLAIEGGSNGGTLVAACCNQRPDLYGAGIAHVGVLDMLRFHRFTIGYAWKSDYGCADDDGFDYLRAYSPLHNVPDEGPYPQMLVLTADHDDRVVPLHSFKYVAELQHKLGEKVKTPLLSRIEVKAGHGAGKSLTKTVDERADVVGFLARVLGAKWVPG